MRLVLGLRLSGDEKARRGAMTDPLTGLANSRYLFIQLEKELARARRSKRTVAVAVLISLFRRSSMEKRDSSGVCPRFQAFSK